MTPVMEVEITVTNSNDPECRRMTLTERHEVVMDGNSSNDITELIAEVERRFSEVFPRNMTYVVPFTMIDISKVGILNEEPPFLMGRDDALELLKQCYASGQLEGTIIGGKLRDYFGVSYSEIDAKPYSDPAAQTVSLGGQS